jgi:hypothetical protein
MNRSSIIYLLVFSLALGCETEGNLDAGFGSRFFLKTFGVDGNQEAVDLLVNADGSMIVLGNSSSEQGGNQLFIVKTDSLGNTLWEKTYSLDGKDFAADIEHATSGNAYIIAGYRQVSATDADVVLWEVSDAGDIQERFVQTIPGTSEKSKSITPLADGGYILLGDTNQEFATTGDLADNIYIARITATFSVVEQKIYGRSAYESATKLVEQAPDVFVMFFSSNSQGLGDADRNFTIAGIDSDLDQFRGVLDLPTSATDVNDETLNSVAFNASKGYALLGTSITPALEKRVYLITTNPISSDITERIEDDAVTRLNAGREVVGLSFAGNFSGISIAHTRDNNYLALANQEIIIGGALVDENLILIKVSRRGDVLWEVPLGAEFAENGAKVEELPGGQILVLATTSAGSNQTKISLLKLNSRGQFSE